jgi:hypothetical protein
MDDMNNVFRLVTLEQIYEHFDVAHINRLMDYTDTHKRKYNLDNVHIHAPLSNVIPKDENPTLLDGSVEDYKRKVAMLEAELARQRERKMASEQDDDGRLMTSNTNWVRTKDKDDEIVELPANLLKQIAQVLKNNQKK